MWPVQAPRALGSSVESCRDGGVGDQASGVGAASDAVVGVVEEAIT